MPQIIPVTDLRDTNKIVEMCALSNEPIFVTKNGYGSMVVLSIKAYEQLMEENIILERLAQAERGEVLDGKTVMQELKSKYGKSL